MHSRLPTIGMAMGVVTGLIASSLLMAPVGSAAEEESAGNNLAFPVLWSEADYLLPLRGTMLDTTVDGVLMDCSDETVGATQQGAIQKDENNLWQAENIVAPGNEISSLDWGDNIEVKDWNVGNPVRIETALYADRTSDPMTGYLMCHIDGRGQDEVWGAQVQSGMGEDSSSNEDMSVQAMSDSLIEFESEEAMVYTAGARLTIQRIDEGATPTWDATERRWTGQGVADPVFNGAVHEKTTDGPGSYGAEINVSGKVIFGFNWQTDGLFNGEYRITFSLDGPVGTFPGSGTSLANATIRQSVEEVAGDELSIRSMPSASHGGGPGGGHGGGGTGGGSGSGGEGGGNTAVMVGEQNLSFIDVGLTGGEDPPVTPDPVPTNPPAPPSGETGTSTPSSPTDGGSSSPGASGSAPAGAGQPEAGVPVEVASPVGQRIAQRAPITAPKSSKQRVRTRLMLTREPIFTDQGVTIRWRVTKRSQDNCTIRNRNGEVTVKFTKRGRCTVIAWAPSPNPQVFAPFKEKRIYKVRNTV